MKAITAIALLTGAAVVTAATVAIVLKKRSEKNSFHYDAGDLEDDCCTCEVCGDDLDLEQLAEELDDADVAEVMDLDGAEAADVEAEEKDA
ncbi:MAG: hypothetical protein IJY85_05265 [Ruminococcus sp.]|nr:hypothetical protein [Ruminococcus sp.]